MTTALPPARTRPATLTDRELQSHVTSDEAECVRTPIDSEVTAPGGAGRGRGG